MRIILILLSIGLLSISCGEERQMSSIDPINWENRSAPIPVEDSLVEAKTYLGVYSEIYSTSEHNTHDLTVTVSLRNTSNTEPLYLKSGNYYSTSGALIRTYFDFPIALKPLETIEIIIEENDKTGGSGANFIFDWLDNPDASDPIFEAVMISTRGTQGLSFTSVGKRIQ